MYLLEILILSSDSKEVIYIRRPCVWICTICMLLLVWFHATHMQEQWQKNYPYEALLTKNNDKINACIKGIYYRAESTDSSNRLYLKKVSVHISGQKVYNFSNMIVYSDQTSSLIPGNTIQCFGTLKNFATASNPGEFDQKQYYRELNFYYQLYADQIEVVSGHSNILFTKLDEIRLRLSTSIESGLPDKQAGIMKAVLLGQKTELPSDIKQLYQQNGIGHLLAISGVKTQNLAIPLHCRNRINSAFVPLHIAKIYILKLCLDEEIFPRCRFPCSRGYFRKCINWQKKQ